MKTPRDLLNKPFVVTIEGVRTAGILTDFKAVLDENGDIKQVQVKLRPHTVEDFAFSDVFPSYKAELDEGDEQE